MAETVTTTEAIIATLSHILYSYTREYPAFRSMPCGAPHSQMREEQDYKIKLEDDARTAIATAKEMINA